MRAFVQRIAPATIARLYYDSDEHPHAASAEAMTQYLRTMRDELVHLALEHGSPVLASDLTQSMRRHGEARLGAESLRMVGQAAQLAVATLAPEHGVGLWFRPLIAQRLKGWHIGPGNV